MSKAFQTWEVAVPAVPAVSAADPEEVTKLKSRIQDLELMKGRLPAVPAACSEEVTKLKSRIQDLELMNGSVTNRYFLQPQFEKLPPLALRVLSYWFGPEYDGKDV